MTDYKSVLLSAPDPVTFRYEIQTQLAFHSGIDAAVVDCFRVDYLETIRWLHAIGADHSTNG